METTNHASRPVDPKIFETTGAIGTIRTIIRKPSGWLKEEQKVLAPVVQKVINAIRWIYPRDSYIQRFNNRSLFTIEK